MDQASHTQQVKMDGVEVKAPPPSADIFVSYASDAGAWAERLIDMLTRPGARVDSAAEGTRSSARQAPGSQRYAAFVALVTPEYVANNEAGIDTSAFIGPGGGGARRFAVHLQRAPWEELPWMARFTVLPGDGRAVLDADDPDRVLAEIAGTIRAQVDASPPPESPGPAPSDRAGQEVSAVGYFAQKFRLGDTVYGMLSYAAEETLQHKQALLDTATLFEAIAGEGRADVDPRWTSDWLQSRAPAAIAAVRGRRRTGIGGEFVVALEPPVSRGVAEVFDSAAKIAQRTSGAPEIRTRHLLAALLTDQRGAHSRLMQLLHGAEIDVAALLEDFYDFVRGDTDNDQEWARILLREIPSTRVLAHFDADDSRGDDYLGVREDVDAFAKLIAARTLTPPLSIGLFGEWGSGKTFFMRMLRAEVDRLARQVDASGRMQRDLPYWKRIVQIEFNAWHYVEEKLWASLAQHIFQSLRLPHDANESRDLQTSLAAVVEKEKQLETAAEQRKQQVEQQLTAAREELEKAQQALSEAELKVAREGILGSINRADLRAAGVEALARLGFVDLGNSTRNLYESLESARAELTRARGVLAPLFRGAPGERALRWLFLIAALAAAPVVGLLVRWGTAALGAEGIDRIAGFVTGAAGLIAAGRAWVKKQLATVRGWLDEVEKVQGRLDEHLREEQDRVRGAETQLSAGTAASADALRELQTARQGVAAAETRLHEASLAGVLTHFVAERITSDQYGKELGTLARIRIDLERLSRLIEEENWRLTPPVPDEDVSGRVLPRYVTLEDERRHHADRVNRIVLYIDDLDRCPPARVVEVLQAVHLLLAFPLFVVVVGVDARWITRSLEARYRELLSGDGRGGTPDVDEFRALFGSATAHDYLEKIFQVPFWLRPMGDEGTRAMMSGLLAPGLAPQSKTEPVPAAASDAPNSEASLQAESRSPTGFQTPETLVGEPGATVGGDAAVPARAEQHGETPAKGEEPDLAAASLEITDVEMRFMNELAPLLGRSPRALKRFVNVYRLIKAGLRPHERRAFIPKDGRSGGDYRAVLFLLAVDTGTPHIAVPFFQMLATLADPTGWVMPEGPQVAFVISQMEGELGTYPDWKRVKAWLDKYQFQPADVAAVMRWLPRISRFSFHTGRVSSPAPDSAPGSPKSWVQKG